MNHRPTSMLAGAVGLFALIAPVEAQMLSNIEPAYSIWDVVLGEPVAQIPKAEVTELACGTNGGPPSNRLADFADFAQCPAEPSGLHEVYFAYDDEKDYIARALEIEYKVVQGGTSIYAHPVVLSVLVDREGIVRGIRIVTDDRIALRSRRVAVNLARNLKTRFGGWDLACAQIPLRPGEKPVGNQFVHETCEAADAAGAQELFIESYYYRKRGQEAVNRETQEINGGYFHSGTRFELVEVPYEPRATANG